MLGVSAVSVVIVIIAICDMPRQEFSLRGRVYIHNTYMKAESRVLKHDANFEKSFQEDLCLIPVQLGEAKIFKETGSVKNRKVNHRRHVLKEETLDEIGERLEHTPQKSLKCLSQETGVVSVSSVQRATTLLKLHIRIVNIHTFKQ